MVVFEWLMIAGKWLMTAVEWMNQNVGFVMTMLTGVYVLSTARILLALRKTNRLQIAAIEQNTAFERSRSRPHVVFAIQSELRDHAGHGSTSCDVAIVKNLGATSAHNISITVTPELSSLLDTKENSEEAFRTPAMLKRPISILIPGSEIKEVIAPRRFPNESNSNDELSCQVEVAYLDVTGMSYKESFVIVLDTHHRDDVLDAKNSSTLDSSQSELQNRLMDACKNGKLQITIAPTASEIQDARQNC